MSFIITGTGRAVPERTVTNDELSTMMETSDEWISTRTGIRERRVLTHETLLGLTAAAGRAALENAGVSPDEIDLLLVTTLQGDCVSPSLCCLAAGELGCRAARRCSTSTWPAAASCTRWTWPIPTSARARRPRRWSSRRRGCRACSTGATARPACCSETARARRCWNRATGCWTSG